jgi:hypothetical protein
MNKVYGKKSGYAPVREDTSRIIASYGMEPVADPNYATWYEVYFYKKQKPLPTKDDIHAAIIADINAHTDERILTGFVWTPVGGNPVNVWLSAENQRNFSEGQRMAKEDPSILPITYKIGETADQTPVYHTFDNFEELDSFYKQAFAYINQCIQEGWAKKDSINKDDYEWPIKDSE